MFLRSPDKSNFSNIIKDKSKLKKIKECYKSLKFQDLNETSLVLYHAPLNTDSIITRNNRNKKTCSAEFPNRVSLNFQKAIGHFLTGDINFNHSCEELKQHFNGYLSSIETALVPHHGSAYNWNKTAFNMIPNSCLWVTSSGITNRYGHPCPKVCEQIERKGNSLGMANEGTEISTQETLIFDN